MTGLAVNARSLSGFIKCLRDFRIQLHNQGSEKLANQVYELEQDCIFDNYMDLRTAKSRLIRVLS